AYRRAVLESMSRSTAHEPHVLGARMAIDDEVLVRRVLVLTHPGLEQRGALERRKAVREVVARGLARLARRQAPPAGQVEPRPRLSVPPPFRQKPLQYRGASASRREIAAVPLEDRPAHALAVDLRVTLRGLRARQRFEPSPGLLEDRQGGLFVRVVILDEPQHADRMEETLPPAPPVVLP